MKEELEDLLRYYRREAAGEERAAATTSELIAVAEHNSCAETWRRAAELLEAAMGRAVLEEETAARWRNDHDVEAAVGGFADHGPDPARDGDGF